MYQLLSYPIGSCVPAWPGSPQLSIEKKLQIANGDAANTAVFSMYNHTGTHFDAPNHYLPNGLPIGALGLDRFIFEEPLLLEIPKGPCGRVEVSDLEPYQSEIAGCSLLMIYTGFSRYRTEDPDLFEQKGPGIASQCAKWLVEQFPGLRAVAVDFVSLASYSDQEDGNETHRILLGGKDGHFVCGIEDVNMVPVLGKRLKKVFALPLFVEGLDSAPVTIVAEMEEEPVRIG